ncbi:hypothetical protein WHI96_13195 [Pseudonocardia tropica]|uniref:Thioesterase domain-containing protein n=1 Tax=Pseudonocardia tropica TaxID=681289 RepID=A0ABV1JV12_9PSEU
MTAVQATERSGALQHRLDGYRVTAERTTRYRASVPLGTTPHLDAVIESVAGRELRVRGAGRLDAPDGTVAGSATALVLGATLDHFRRWAPEGTRSRERRARRATAGPGSHPGTRCPVRPLTRVTPAGPHGEVTPACTAT